MRNEVKKEEKGLEEIGERGKNQHDDDADDEKDHRLRKDEGYHQEKPSLGLTSFVQIRSCYNQEYYFRVRSRSEEYLHI
jgi:hypothetical protein